MTVSCRCGVHVCCGDDVCFYFDGSGVHLIVKPERRAVVEESVALAVAEKYANASCKACAAKLGVVTTMGPDGASFLGFGADKVAVDGRTYSKKAKWAAVRAEHPAISARDRSTFFAGTAPPPSQEPKKRSSQEEARPVVLPTEDGHFDWERYIISGKTPRSYQLEAFFEGLQRDLVVCLPTGSGKTLVAALVLAAFAALNPARLAVMVVDRLPLVFQQAECIRRDTGLSVSELCSVTASGYVKKQLAERRCQCVVATAGSLREMLTEAWLSPDDFSAVVFDECHNATGGHSYVHLLRAMARARHPCRLLGLSASPVDPRGGAGLAKATEHLGSLFRGPLFRPASLGEYAAAAVDFVEAALKPSARRFDAAVLAEIRRLVSAAGIPRIGIDPGVSLADGHQQVVHLVSTAQAGAAERESPGSSELFGALRKLLDAWPIAEALGTRSALRYLGRDLAGVAAESSSAFDAVVAELSRSPGGRALVFVETQLVCGHLAAALEAALGAASRAVVGHTGMDWASQEAAVEEFRAGSVRVIVATSVLEEGFDVPECDLVIRMDFSATVRPIRFIQTKGRARANRGGMKCIVRPGLPSTLLELEGAMVAHVVQETEKAGLPSRRTRAMLAQPDVHRRTRPVSLARGRFAAEFLVAKSTGKDSDRTIASLGKALEPYFGCDSDAAAMSSSTREARILVEFHAVGEASVAKLCAEWSFRVDKRPVFYAPQTLPAAINRPLPAENVSVTVGFLSRSMQTFHRGDCSLPLCAARFDGEVTLIACNFSVVITAADILDCIVVDAREHHHTLYIHMTTPPDCRMDPDVRPELVAGIEEQICRFRRVLGAFPCVALRVHVAVPFEKGGRAVRCGIAVAARLTRVAEEPVSVEEPSWGPSDGVLEMLVQGRRGGLAPHNPGSAGRGLPLIVEGCLRVFEDARCLGATPAYLAAVRGKLRQALAAGQSDRELERGCRDVITADFPESKHLFWHVSRRDAFSFMPAVCVTPYRVKFVPPIMVSAGSRMLRLLASRGISALTARVCSENYNGRVPNPAVLASCLVSCGIAVGGVQFNHLGSSMSQLRRGCALCVAAPAAACEELRAMVGGIPDTFKRMSRFALLLSSDRAHLPPTAEHPLSHRVLRDTVNRKGHLLTDGSGFIDPATCLALVRNLHPHLETPPAAVQVRFAGMKGVLVTDFAGAHTSRQVPVAARDSMVKFRPAAAAPAELCLCDYSRDVPAHLNKEAITLLTAASTRFAGAAAHVRVEELLEQELEGLRELLFDDVRAFETLRPVLNQLPVDRLREAGVHLFRDPFFADVLRCVYRSRVNLLRTKTRVPVPDGRHLLGIPDPTGVLHDGEVYASVRRRPEDGYEPVLGPLLVYRNPCLHPGDVRVVTGVARGELRAYVDVVVFPAGEECRSVPGECSGGDLDGDSFSVVWDGGLVPESTAPPCDYDALAREARREAAEPAPEDPRLIHTIPGEEAPAGCIPLDVHFGKVIANEYIGRVAHLHLALTDILADGASDPLCVSVAESQSTAVDYPKTGVAPCVPVAGKEIVETAGYPDHMMKPSSVSYRSGKVLGRMYRRCVAASFDDAAAAGPDRAGEPGAGLVTKGQAAHAEWAGEFCERYSHDVAVVVARFGVRSVGELLVGLPRGADKHFSGLLVRDAMRLAIDDVHARYKRLFDEACLVDGTADFAERRKRASAVYAAGIARGEPCGVCWFVAADVLADVKVARGVAGGTGVEQLALGVGLGMREDFTDELPRAHADQLSRAEVVQSIEDCLSDVGGSVSVFGSSALFTCGPFSDLDLCVALPAGAGAALPAATTERARQRAMLETVVFPRVAPRFDRLRVVDSDPPIIKARTGGAPALSVDLTLSADGVRKAALLRSVVLDRRNPSLFLAYRAVTTWARACGLVASGDPRLGAAAGEKDEGVLHSGELQLFFLACLRCPGVGLARADRVGGAAVENEACAGSVWLDRDGALAVPVRPSEEGGQGEWASLDELSAALAVAGDAAAATGGRVFLHFLEVAAKTPAETVLLSWPPEVCGRPTYHLDAATVHVIRDLALRALHCVVYTSSFADLLSDAAEEGSGLSTMLTRLPKGVPTTDFYKIKLSVPGVDVHLDTRHGATYLRAEGTRAQISALRAKVREFRREWKTRQVGRTEASRYQFEDSALLAFIGAEPPGADTMRVEFGALAPRCCSVLHRAMETSCVLLQTGSRACAAPQAWAPAASAWAAGKAAAQLLSRRNDAMPSAQCLVRASFGRFYVRNAQTQQHTLASLSAGLRVGRRYRRQAARGEYRTADHRKERPPMVKEKMKEAGAGKTSKPAKPMKVNASFHLQLSDGEGERLKRVLRTVLAACGFAAAPAVQPHHPWRVEFRTTRCFSLLAEVDDNLRVVATHERPLSWLAATFLHARGSGDDAGGERQAWTHWLATHDVGVQVRTETGVDARSDLFGDVLPADRRVLRLDSDGCPQPSFSLDTTGRDCLSYARNRITVETYGCEVEGLCAVVTTGVHYYFTGDTKPKAEPFVEFVLKAFDGPLKVWISGAGRSVEPTKEWIREITAKAFEVSEALRAAEVD
ncbi:hypothetical protein DIPPA_03987 [Diplonema papillatum]|nr:hypothetical protein DIPPA_03987 [Diplonema papillatum]